jgi:quercetin dioxygenase-like cupin family protein
MFRPHGASELVAMIEGVSRQTLVHGERTLLAEFHLKQGHTLPRHAHPHEQAGYLVSGHLRFSIGAETFDARPGDSWCVPGGVEHGAEIVEDSIAIEVFSPVREDYLPQGR